MGCAVAGQPVFSTARVEGECCAPPGVAPQGLLAPGTLRAGLDMTDEQLSVAHKYLDSYTKEVLGFSTPNMKFVKVCRPGAAAP